ncbi:MAG: sel1 repeat family protein [Halomonadaceae bacterium]|nr:MAG: sel1 repeat family protein [Halomonadaceae bacterium]
MKTLLVLLVVMLLTACASATFEDGQQARDDGDLKQAASIWSERAGDGDDRALYALYRLYRATGVGFVSDRQAREALEKLAGEYQQPAAQFLLAEQLLEERELEAGREWMTRSADGNYGEARAYMQQQGPLLSRKIRLLRGSAAQQTQLGNDLYFGRNGVSRDHAEAAIWYQKAAQRGSAEAQSMLAYQYLEGQGVTEDRVKAYQWYREAAMQGLPSAQGNLGYLYGAGRGTDQNDIKAYAWSVLASENGYGPAETNKDVYLARLSNAQRLESLNEIRRLENIITPLR